MHTNWYQYLFGPGKTYDDDTWDKITILSFDAIHLRKMKVRRRRRRRKKFEPDRKITKKCPMLFESEWHQWRIKCIQKWHTNYLLSSFYSVILCLCVSLFILHNHMPNALMNALYFFVIVIPAFNVSCILKS